MNEYSFSNDDKCYACETGFFSNSTDITAPTCHPCPAGCTKCYSDSNQMPVCEECADTWALDVLEGTCFECNPMCSTCRKTPTFCDACNSPYLHITYSETNKTCVEDVYCGDRCLLCNNTDQMQIDFGNNGVVPSSTEVKQVVCLQCEEEMFAFGKNCYHCPVGCSYCYFSYNSEFWTLI